MAGSRLPARTADFHRVGRKADYMGRKRHWRIEIRELRIPESQLGLGLIFQEAAWAVGPVQ
jgi:hypothetical protein